MRGLHQVAKMRFFLIFDQSFVLSAATIELSSTRYLFASPRSRLSSTLARSFLSCIEAGSQTGDLSRTKNYGKKRIECSSPFQIIGPGGRIECRQLGADSRTRFGLVEAARFFGRRKYRTRA